MKRYLLPPLLSALAAAALLWHDAARAETDFHDIPTDGHALVVAAGGKVAWVDGVGTNASWTPTLKLVRESRKRVPDVTARSWTNYTYGVVTSWKEYALVTTNAAGAYATNVVRVLPDTLPATLVSFATNSVAETNVVANPPRRLAPDVTAVLTNALPRAEYTTNWAVRLVAAKTNSVTAGTSYAAPGDLLMLSSPATDPAARVTAAIER